VSRLQSRIIRERLLKL